VTGRPPSSALYHPEVRERAHRERRRRGARHTATADVLKVISRSAFGLNSVLQTLVEAAARLCEADSATMTQQKDGVFFRAEGHGFSPQLLEYAMGFR
jgi:hypothetical protein